MSDLHRVVGRVPSYARQGAKWYCSPVFSDTVLFKLLTASGGATPTDLSNGATRNFLGYPIELVEVLPTSEANSQIPLLFGNLSQAGDFGDRRMLTVTYSNSGYVDGAEVFTTDEILVRGTERFDINVHSVGSSSTAGPIVGLITQSS